METTTVQSVGDTAAVPGAGLHRRVLSDVQLLAQSVSGMGPSIGAAALVPLVFAASGGGAWLTTALATLGILGVGICVTELAARHVSTGSLYTLVPKGLGPVAGLVTAGAMFLNTFVSGTFLALGVGIFFTQFLVSTGLVASGSLGLTVAIDLISLFVVTAVAYLDIRISTRLLLAIEFTSMAAITILLLVVVAKQGIVFDHSQLTLHGVTGHGMLLAIVFMVLAFGGFEGSASLGLEARRPQRGVRIAVIGTVLLAGLFFVFNSYAQVLGFQGTGLSLTSQTAPLSALANHYGVSWLGDIVVLGAAFSFFGALNAWLNYLARMVFTMGSDRVLPRVFSRAHPRTGSPYVAVVAWAVIWFGVTIYVFASGTNLTHAFGDFGTFSGYCWTLVYLLVALAAPIYFLRKRVPNPTVIVAGLVGAAVMVIEFYYSFNPMPTGALAIYVYIFAAGTIAATIGGIIAYKLAPSWVRRVGQTEEPSRHMDGLAPAVVEQAAAPLVERP